MAIFEICEGAPGQGKSLYTARLTRRILIRNKKWFKKTGVIRPIFSNLKFSEAFEEEGKDFIFYWSDTAELVKLSDCDIIWDEIATELDSRNFAELTVEMKRFLSQYRKRGIDIYANTQDFSMIDRRARLMISAVYTLYKVLGSRDISTTKPNPSVIWGLVMIRRVQNFKEDNPEKKKYDFMPSFMFIEKELVSLYDTRQDIPMGRPAPLKHKVLYCEFYGVKGHQCENHCKVVHS
ncbi:MAG: hypothetical protein WC603_02980 [Candidatus Paceibacterota bacterium]|jgi:hypothetical protein